MKTQKTISASLLGLFLALTGSLSAQVHDSAVIKPPVFGLGFKIAQIALSDLLENTMPSNKLLMTITPHKNFRLEGSFGYLSQTSENARGTALEAKSTFLGMSAYGMWQKGKTNFYSGVRLGVLNYSQENELNGYRSNGEPYYYTEKSEGKTNIFGGVIGAEYFFSRHFTIGAEIAVIMANNLENNPTLGGGSTGNNDESTAKTIMTETGLVTRFYF